MSWQVTSSSSISGKRTAAKEKIFFEKSWTFRDPGKSKTETLQPDNYEFPFDLVLEGSLPESVEGLLENWIAYRFKAEIGRKYTKDIVIRKPLRIIRTLDSSALELAHAMSVENVWANKIEYSISTPTKAIIFGTSLQVDFRLVPLLKGLVMGKITTQVKEEQEFVLDPEFGAPAYNSVQKIDRVVASDEYTINNDTDAQILDEEAEGFQFSRFIELPKTLKRCLQDCNVNGVKVKHKLKFNVQLHNPDGHISELRANLPISLYISPSLPINENNDLVDQTPYAARMAQEHDADHSAPPLYGEHQFDQLYSGVDPNGYRTPGNFSTPGTPYSHSRNISSENLASLNAITNGAGLSTSPGGQHVSAAALQSRLQILHVNGHQGQLSAADDDHSLADGAVSSRRNSSNCALQDVFSETNNSGQRSSYGHSPALQNGHNSNPLSRQPSEEDVLVGSGNATPLVRFDEVEDLARVPSYTTAVRTPAPKTPCSGPGNLPTYGDATHSADSPPPIPVEPPSAHMRPSRSGTGTGLGGMGGRRPSAIRSVTTIQDEERRLRTLQARGR
jgi:arrestin-related trafficking adapter 4/5/7